MSGSSPSQAGCEIPAIDEPIPLSRTELAVRVGSRGVRETALLEIAQESWKALTPIEEVSKMKADLRAELGLVNRNVDEMIGLLQRATDAGIWTRQEATRHESRLASLRAKLNADFRELTALREPANGLRLRTQDTHPLTKK